MGGISFLVNNFEVSLPDEFLLSYQRSFGRVPTLAVSELQNCLQKDISSILGEDFPLSVQGSYRKWTIWMGSDVDVLLDTGEREVTREEQKKLTERLSKNPHLSHVGLGCVAIHFSFLDTEIDLVFSNLEEVGKQPPISKEEMELLENSTIRLGALGLKVAVNLGFSCDGRRVANFLLEKLVMRIFSSSSSSSPSSFENTFKNAFGLLIAAVQAIVDTNGEILLSSLIQPATKKKTKNKSLSYETLTSVTKRLSQLLNVFCLSRFFLGGGPSKEGFSTITQIEQWLRQSRDTGFPVPNVPGWLVGVPIPKDSPEFLYSNQPSSSSSSLPPQDIMAKFEGVFGARSYELFLATPLGKYVLAPRRDKLEEQVMFLGAEHVDKLTKDMGELYKLSLMGSTVAQCMYLARETWAKGMGEFSRGNISRAIKLWAKSLLFSRANGDPFHGWIIPNQSPVLEDFFERTRDPNAAVVLCFFLLPQHRWAEAKKVLELTLRSHPTDIGVLSALVIVLGNKNADWKQMGRHLSRLIELEPNEPIHLYWKGVQCRETRNISEGIKCFEEWLSRAPPEGRKVPCAYKDLALLHLLDQKTGFMERFLELYEQGVEAENQVLPLLRENDPHPADSVYQTALMTLKRRPKTQNPLVSKTREQGMERVSEGLYREAIAAFSLCLKSDANDRQSLSMRCSSYMKLQLYTKAVIDAMTLVKRHPNHKESYLRLVDVRLLMKDPAKALVACRSGLSRFPSSLELKKSEEDAMAMSQKMKGPSEQKIDPKSLPCYSKEVKYKENCVVVDAWGRGNFVSLVDALDVHATSRKPKITLIIVGCGPFTFCEPITISVASSIQIIGGVNSTHGKKKGGKTQGSSSSPLKSELKGTHQGVLFKVEGVDPKGAVDLHLQNLELHAQGHCVRAAEKANVKVENCFATSYGFASFSSYKGGKLVLEQCKVPRKSNGGIVVYDAEVTAMDCRFEGSEVVSISVQNKSKCVMSGCRIVKSHAQGVIVFVGGVAEMNDCEVVECGKMPQKSGILVQDGLLRMKRCVVERNKAQGIVVQGEGDGQLFMEECTVSQNATTQVCVFQGSINIADSTILDPKIGIMFGSETPRPSSIRRCRVTSIVNTPKDALLYGNTIEKPEVENINSPDVLAEIQKMDNISSPKLPPKLSFSNITPENFEFHFVREGILKLIPNLLLCAGSQKAVLSTKQLNVPSRITPDDQLRPTSIKKAWGSTQERSVGKVLTGTVRSPCAYIASVLTVLVDEEGDAVFLALYNFPGVTRETTTREINQLLPIGSKITIKEPYLHKFASGSIGIRVENQSDFEINSNPEPRICFCCGKEEGKGGGGKLKKCIKCRIGAVYCGRDCQREDWKIHKMLHK